MRIFNFKASMVAIACAMLATPAYAVLTIDDFGVVGTVETQTGESSNIDDEVAFTNYLLSLGANVIDNTADANSSGEDETYNTGDNDYNGTVSGGDKTNCVEGEPCDVDVSGYEYVIAKYDGQNAGYVVFYVPDFGNTIPLDSWSIWSPNPTNEEGYELSHWTGFGTSVPDGGTTLMLLGAALGGLGVARRFMKF